MSDNRGSDTENNKVVIKSQIQSKNNVKLLLNIIKVNCRKNLEIRKRRHKKKRIQNNLEFRQLKTIQPEGDQHKNKTQ